MGDWYTEPLEELAQEFTGPEWEQTVKIARQENEWFTPIQIGQAISALRREMLTPARLREWLSGYRKPADFETRQVGIVMAGNLPLVGFADLAAVVVAGHRAVVKPSSKDRALTRFVIKKLRESGCEIESAEELQPEELDGVIATGGDAARAHFARRFSGIPALLRGNRQSVAVLTGRETDGEIKSLADDMFLYWGLGCRSVTRLFVPRGWDMEAFAEKMSRQAPESHPKYAECYRYARAMAAMGADRWADGGFFVLRQVDMHTGPVAPRVAEVLWSEYGSADETAGWLARHEGVLQCAAGAVPESFPRRAALGRTQFPGWRDYADGVDTMEFLLGL
ncbi:acyl-CoA reductase [uncultured Rikenella sp.]|uniref:acyl-CoA reductase n=1 Tax=uncultured Rikenella sp. TaxID=368003 RepID=UPI00262F9E2F|nr:acyl-CoA reductase [uncultured Rikenella sp.]